MEGFLLVLNFLALGCLALAMPLHHRRVFQREGGSRALWGMRLLGWTGLCCSLVVSVRGDKWQVGLVTWVVMLAVAGVGLTMLLAYAPRRLLVVAGATGVLLGVGLLITR